MEHKINTEKKIRYVASNFATGLGDVTLRVRKPNGDLFDFGSGTSLILTETFNGEYEGDYTPDTLGIWQELVTSATNGDKAVRSYIVVAVDLAEIKTSVDALGTHLDTIEDKVDTVDTVVDGIVTNVAAVKTELDTVDGKINTLDTVVDSIKTELDTVDGKVNTLDTVTGSIKTELDTVDGKVDTIDTNVDSIKGTIEGLALQINPGGYFSN